MRGSRLWRVIHACVGVQEHLAVVERRRRSCPDRAPPLSVEAVGQVLDELGRHLPVPLASALQESRWAREREDLAGGRSKEAEGIAGPGGETPAEGLEDADAEALGGGCQRAGKRQVGEDEDAALRRFATNRRQEAVRLGERKERGREGVDRRADRPGHVGRECPGPRGEGLAARIASPRDRAPFRLQILERRVGERARRAELREENVAEARRGAPVPAPAEDVQHPGAEPVVGDETRRIEEQEVEEGAKLLPLPSSGGHARDPLPVDGGHVCLEGRVRSAPRDHGRERRPGARRERGIAGKRRLEQG